MVVSDSKAEKSVGVKKEDTQFKYTKYIENKYKGQDWLWELGFWNLGQFWIESRYKRVCVAPAEASRYQLPGLWTLAGGYRDKWAIWVSISYNFQFASEAFLANRDDGHGRGVKHQFMKMVKKEYVRDSWVYLRNRAMTVTRAVVARMISTVWSPLLFSDLISLSSWNQGFD